MSPFFRRNWTLEYLVIRPDEWERKRESDFWLHSYEVLDRWEAAHVLEEIARKDRKFLCELERAFLPRLYTSRPVPGSYEEAQEDKHRLDELKWVLGSVSSQRGQPPRLASFYVCRQKRAAVVREPLPDPWKGVREAIEAAKQAPRGYVVIEAVTEAGAPLPRLQLEVLLADGELLTRATDAQGQLRLDPIPQGQCHIRVPTLDGSAWHPAEGPASTRVDKGHKRAHVVQKGENLTRIARQYGIKGWKKLWEAPENETLRKKRRSPHVLYPGDEVVVPGLDVHEIVRPTDQTHRIVVGREQAVVALLNTHLLDDPGSVAAHWAGGQCELGRRQRALSMRHEPGSTSG